MTEVTLAGRRVRLDPARLLGSGGEADVYDIGSGLALKVYKGPDHPDYRGQPDEQTAARERLRSRAEKLREFPSGLPNRVVVPLEPAFDRARKPAGFSMRLVPSAEPLIRWSDPAFRRAVPPATVAPLFLDLHATVARLHELAIVIGDFNDLNALVSAGGAYLIDADSFQFGRHPCLAYTDRFTDPVLLDPGLRLVRPFSAATDWYAFDALLFQSLLLVHPYGGVLHGKGRYSDRLLGRISVLDPRVRYPKAALPWRALPDELLQRFHQTFAQDVRAPFPRALLEDLRWTRCPQCGGAHARPACPACRGTGAGAKREIIRIRGRVKATRLLDTEGEVLAVSPDGWLVYQNGEFRREDGRVSFRGPLRPGVRYLLDGGQTLSAGREEAFAAAGGRTYWERDGALWRGASPAVPAVDGAPGEPAWRGARFGDERVGEVLAGQTRLWAGPDFGFGFYRAGGVTVAFLFDRERRGLADGVALPPLRGRVLDAGCVFGDGRAWLLLALEAGGRVTRRCTVIRKDGAVLASLDAPPWLETVHGACAAGPYLFAPTDRGVVRVDETLARAAEYPETEPFVDSASRLAVASDGLLVANRREVLKLEIRQEVTV